jgi:hypothetical protein
MASLPLPTARRRLFWGNTLDAHIMGNSPPAWFDQIHRGGGDLHNNSPGRFEGVVTATTWGNRHCLLPPPTAFLRLFRGNALDAHIMGKSPPARFDQIHLGGGDLHNNSPGQFEGVFAHGLFTPFLGFESVPIFVKAIEYAVLRYRH